MWILGLKGLTSFQIYHQIDVVLLASSNWSSLVGYGN